VTARRPSTAAQADAAAPLMDAHVLIPAFAAVRRLGRSPEKVLARLGLTNVVVPDRTPRLTERATREVLDGLANEADDRLFGLTIGDELRSNVLGIVHYLPTTAQTVADAFEMVAQYTHLLDGVTRVEVERSGGEMGVTFRGVDPDHMGVQGALAILNASRRGIGFMAGREIDFVLAWMPQEPPEKSRLLRTLRIPAINVLQPSTGFVIGKEAARLSLVSADPVLHDILRQRAELLSARMITSSSYRGVSTEIIRAQLMANQSVSLASTARKLGMSERTLQRKLLKESTSFQDVMESVRSELARQILLRGEHSVADVAYLLQYADVSAFIRAFRKWTGSTPGEILKLAQDARRRPRSAL
jgi:AraC-like DNA-binding protein